jgi:hypothetical protein
MLRINSEPTYITYLLDASSHFHIYATRIRLISYPRCSSFNSIYHGDFILPSHGFTFTVGLSQQLHYEPNTGGLFADAGLQMELASFHPHIRVIRLSYLPGGQVRRYHRSLR